MSDLQDVHTELQKEIKEIKEDLQSRPTKADFDGLKNKLSSFEKEHILPFNKDLETVKEAIDTREQSSRNYCIRLNGAPVPEAQAKNISEYDHAKLCMAAVHEILKPVLTKKTSYSYL